MTSRASAALPNAGGMTMKREDAADSAVARDVA
jgi:hypothetical protein